MLDTSDVTFLNSQFKNDWWGLPELQGRTDDPLLCIISISSTKSFQQLGNRSKYGICVMERVEEHSALLHKLAWYKWFEGPQLAREPGCWMPVVPQQSRITREPYRPGAGCGRIGALDQERKKLYQNHWKIHEGFHNLHDPFCHSVQKSEDTVATHFLHTSLRNTAMLPDHNMATPH